MKITRFVLFSPITVELARDLQIKVLNFYRFLLKISERVGDGNPN